MLALVAMACTGAEEDACPIGSEGCECTAGGSCDKGLACRSDMCVDLAGEGDGDVDSDGDSDGDNACETAGGVEFSAGACVKICKYDEISPGYDLYADCADLKMQCSAQNYCVNKFGTCSTDDECGTGFACVFYTYWGAQCHPLCEEGVDECPAGTQCLLSDADDFWNKPPQHTCHTQ
jgi:hypothetical protein